MGKRDNRGEIVKEIRKNREVIAKNREGIEKNREEIAKNREGTDRNKEIIEKNSASIENVSIQVVKNSEKIEKLLTKEEFDRRMEDFSQEQDKIMTILNRLDQERVFTVERVRRIEEEIGRIKTHLALE